jgi:uncharacterized membrane protein
MENDQTEETMAISVVGYDDEMEQERGIFDRQLVRNVVDVKRLEEEVKSFLGAMESVIRNLSQEVGNYRMDSISVTAEVNAKGKLSLLGSGGEVGGKGGMTFVFKRSSTAQ